MDATAAADVVVIGGGVVGTAAAWRIAQSGACVVLADPAPGSGATGAAAGMLAPVGEFHPGEEELLALNLAAGAGWERYAGDVASASGLETGYRRCGTLVVALDGGDRARVSDRTRVQRELGLDAVPLTSRECRRLEPLLDPLVCGGALLAGDHQVDPRRLLAALRVAAERAGVRVVAQRAEPEVKRGRVTGARLADGELVRAPRVVLATGSRAGTRRHVRPVMGQIARVAMTPDAPVLTHVVRGTVRDREVYLVPREDGELVIGATTEEVTDERVTAGGLYGLLRDAQALVPAIEELEFREVLARTRPGTPDNLPLIGPAKAEGLVLATGHYRGGVLLSGITADAVAAVVSGEPVPDVVAVCDPARLSPPNGPQTPEREVA